MSRIDVDLVRKALRDTVHAPLEPQPGWDYAAVAAVIRDRPDGAEVLLIRRAETEGDPWSGHMALPGGRFDPGDRDLVVTAERETREEVGLDLGAHGSLIGPLEPVPAIARSRLIGMTIAPFVFALERDAPLTPNHEVVEAIWAPLVALAQGVGATTIHWTRDGEDLGLASLGCRRPHRVGPHLPHAAGALGARHRLSSICGSHAWVKSQVIVPFAVTVKVYCVQLRVAPVLRLTRM